MTEQPRRSKRRGDDLQASHSFEAPLVQLGGLQIGRRLTEYFSIVTAGSFALSILANQAVFDRWGLNFLQLATFADVVMSGLSLLFFTIPLAVVFLAAWFAGGLRGRWRWPRRIALGLAVFVLALGLWGLSQGQAEEGAAAAVSTSGVVVVGLLSQAALRFRRRRTLGAGTMAVMTVLLALLTLFQTVAYTVQKYKISGYSGTEPLYLMPAAPDCIGRALWTGERALVLDCGRKGDPRGIRVIFGQGSGLYGAVRPRDGGH